jgi:hypothetical protein
MRQSPCDFPIEICRIPFGMERSQLASQEFSRRTPQTESDGQPFCLRLASQDFGHRIIEDFYAVHLAGQLPRTWLAVCM